MSIVDTENGGIIFKSNMKLSHGEEIEGNKGKTYPVNRPYIITRRSDNEIVHANIESVFGPNPKRIKIHLLFNESSPRDRFVFEKDNGYKPDFNNYRTSIQFFKGGKDKGFCWCFSRNGVDAYRKVDGPSAQFTKMKCLFWNCHFYKSNTNSNLPDKERGCGHRAMFPFYVDKLEAEAATPYFISHGSVLTSKIFMRFLETLVQEFNGNITKLPLFLNVIQAQVKFKDQSGKIKRNSATPIWSISHVLSLDQINNEIDRRRWWNPPAEMSIPEVGNMKMVEDMNEDIPLVAEDILDDNDLRDIYNNEAIQKAKDVLSMSEIDIYSIINATKDLDKAVSALKLIYRLRQDSAEFNDLLVNDDFKKLLSRVKWTKGRLEYEFVSSGKDAEKLIAIMKQEVSKKE